MFVKVSVLVGVITVVVPIISVFVLVGVIAVVVPIISVFVFVWWYWCRCSYC